MLFFVALFVHLRAGTIQANVLVPASLGCTLVLGCMGLPGRSSHQPSLLRSVPSFAVLALILHALSPVLRTLSEATTSDSIWALAAVLFGCHLFLADYSMQPTARSLLSATLSLNLAMCASVVLSSRLNWDMDVFALLLTALQLFAIFPLLRQRIYVAFGAMAPSGAEIPRAVVPLTVAFVGVSVCAFYPLSRAVSLVLIPGSIVFITVLCPLWMRRAQRWKHEMRGPWDEAVLASPPDVALWNYDHR